MLEQKKYQDSSVHSFRKQRTRTLIQLGGLVEKAGLLEEFNISPGDDLQGDFPSQEKASQILGSLLQLKDVLEAEILSKEFLREKGLEKMK